jgi:ankyrin repeat protein
MPELPARPDFEQLRHQAKDLLRATRNGDREALERVRAVSERISLASAQLTVAREYGFVSWTKLKREVQRREILDDRDIERLTRLLAEDSGLATATMQHWCDHPRGASPLGYVAMLRYDTARGVWREVPGTGAIARALLGAGAPVDGRLDDLETPLITAASYGDAEVARALIDAGANLDARAAESSGGVPGGTALLHAAVFGMTDVVDVLVAAGAPVHGIEEAAAAGDISGWLDTTTPADARVRALVMAADHQRLDVIDQLIAAGTPVDAADEAFGGHPLRTAAWNGRPASVRRLLGHGANPNLADEQGRTPLALCRQGRPADDRPARDEVEAILVPLTATDQGLDRHPVGRGTAPHDQLLLQQPAPAAEPRARLEVQIRGSDLPGRRCGPSPEGRMYENIHVGLARRGETIELQPGDALSVRWTFEITIRRHHDGQLDVGGPYVRGARGERFLGLRWGTLAADDTFDVFRAAKLRFADIDPTLIERALSAGSRLVADLGLTDPNGDPVCASVRPPAVIWSIEAG